MEDNGGLCYPLKDDWERAIADLVSLSLVSSGFGSMGVDSFVVDRACEEYGWDFLDSLRIVKRIVNEVYNRKEED